MEVGMASWVKGLLTVLICSLLAPGFLALLNLIFGAPVDYWVALLVGGIFGLTYGLEAGILTIYALDTFKGWVCLLADMTWSLPNTIFGFVFGNIVYLFFGVPSRANSAGQCWISYRARGSSGFGVSTLQVLGTVNIGGAGQHERMHLLQTRAFGPLYLPIFAANYVVNFLIQVLWTFTIGGLLWLLKVRVKPYFSPPSRSVVSGFFGWIYYANLFELWAYASGNP
jgi:hypothetical protein